MLSKQLTHRTLIQYDKTIGHQFIPNIVMRQPYSEKPYYVKTNSQGFRSNFEYEKIRTNNELRIGYIGDSFTAGEGVANEKRFSDIVSKAFNAKSYNFALSASGTDQQYLIYKNIASDFEHDVLVISPHIINIYRNLLSSRISVESQTGKEILVPKPYFTIEEGELVQYNVSVPIEREIVHGFSEKHKIFKINETLSKVFRKYIPKQLKEELKKIQSIEHQGYANENDPRWILMRHLLEGIINLAGDIPIILAPLPYHEIHRNPDYRDRFKNLAKKYDNVTFVDILEKFKKIQNTDDLFFVKDSHYSELGHQIISDKIIEVIKQKGILKSYKQSIIQKKILKKSKYIIGVSAFYHDSSCALIKDGEIIAAVQEERFTRIKNDSSFPSKAINYCLEEARISVDDVEAIVFYDNPYITLERIIASQITAFPNGSKLWKELFPKWVQTKLHIPDIIRTTLNYSGTIDFALHHLSHAASTYYPSPFSNSAILTIDGVGEWATATISLGVGNEIKILKEMNYPHSVGLLYSAFTYYTGFKVNEGEYKLMGLAPYGEPTYVELIKKEIVKINEDGSIQLNMEYFGFQEELCMINEKFENLFGGPPHDSKNEITKRIRDIAKSIQVVTEEIVIKMAKHAKQITGAENLCLAGGVALNCVANGKLLLENIFKNIWIQPAAGDSGGALGAALALYYKRFNVNNKNKEVGSSIQGGSCLGPSFSNDEIKAHLDSFGYKYIHLNSKKRNKILAKYISEGKIVGHFLGRMEYGPRALGARSILADPRSETAQSILNLKIKFRESFRPFAPSVLEEDIYKFFNLHQPSPYMLIVANVNDDRCIKKKKRDKENDLIKIVNQKRSDLPAITHIDYSARIQSVNKEDHSIYYDLIKEFKELTGYGVIINTSFNVNGEPIVCTPKDAVRCFMKTDMDILIMNNFLLLKKDQKESELDKIGQTKISIIKNRNNNASGVQNDTFQLFNKYFPIFTTHKKLIMEDGIYINKDSTWVNSSNQNYFISESPNKSIEPKDITLHWKVIPKELRKEYEPFLKEIIKLSKKHKLELEDVNNIISDSMYVMF